MQHRQTHEYMGKDARKDTSPGPVAGVAHKGIPYCCTLATYGQHAEHDEGIDALSRSARPEPDGIGLHEDMWARLR